MSQDDAAEIGEAGAIVREGDRPRYYATLFAPAPIRADLFALFGFAVEIARIPNLVSNPPLGEIRLQFWRDQLEAFAESAAEPSPPALRALCGAISRFRLPVPPLLALIDAHRADLYGDPPGSLGDVEGYLGETQSALFQLGALVAGSEGLETADLSGHAGVAYGLALSLVRLAADRARGHTLLPLDLLAAEGLSATDVFAPEPNASLASVVETMTDSARAHLGQAQALLAETPRSLQPIFLPLAVVDPLLNRIEQLGPAILRSPAALSDLQVLSRISWARLRGVRPPNYRRR